MKSRILLAIILLFLVGCASITSGRRQTIDVDTSPITGATCSLENSAGVWYLPSTPGRVVVNRGYEDLQVVCNKPGYKRATKAVRSKTENSTYGNIPVPFVGIIGSAIDMADGAAFVYPKEIRLPIERG